MALMVLDDFVVGQTFVSGPVTIDEDAIKQFAASFDPQPFHTDSAAAQASFFGGLAASGWHTAALTMRMLVDSDIKPAGGLIGAGFDDLRWPRPVRPGDTLRVAVEVLETRQMRSRPEQGMVKVRMTTLNQHDQEVQIGICNLVVRTALTGA